MNSEEIVHSTDELVIPHSDEDLKTIISSMMQLWAGEFRCKLNEKTKRYEVHLTGRMEFDIENNKIYSIVKPDVK